MKKQKFLTLTLITFILLSSASCAKNKYSKVQESPSKKNVVYKNSDGKGVFIGRNFGF